MRAGESAQVQSSSIVTINTNRNVMKIDSNCRAAIKLPRASSLRANHVLLSLHIIIIISSYLVFYYCLLHMAFFVCCALAFFFFLMFSGSCDDDDDFSFVFVSARKSLKSVRFCDALAAKNTLRYTRYTP